jgi:tetratricopeptide (TPR) repeat protein
MKAIIGIIIFVLLAGCVTKDEISEIHQNIQMGEFSKARELFEQHKYKLHKTDYLYFLGSIQNGLEENEQSITSFKKLLNECSGQLSDSLKINILTYQIDNYQRIGDYHSAVAIRDSILIKYISRDSMIIIK